MSHKSGFANIVGLPNAGKSTLLNALLGEKLVIATPRAQTTRHRILGIYNDDDHQIVFSDTPGFIDKPAYELHKFMLRQIDDTFEDADVIVYMIDVSNNTISEELTARVLGADAPIILVLNKIDLLKQEEVVVKIGEWKERFPNAEIMAMSALHNFNVAELLGMIKEKIPVHPPYFPKDIVSDRFVRFFVSELIREQIFFQYHQEVPFSTEVIIQTYKEETTPLYIEAEIWVLRESQKAIILGEGGKAIKRLGIASRRSIEEYLENPVYLKLQVKVKPDWRDNPDILRKLGFNQ